MAGFRLFPSRSKDLVPRVLVAIAMIETANWVIDASARGAKSRIKKLRPPSWWVPSNSAYSIRYVNTDSWCPAWTALYFFGGSYKQVGSLASKPKRDLLMLDFFELETISFPPEGSTLTPAHHYSEFRFKIYAPTAFRFFRHLFGIQPDFFMVRLFFFYL